MADKISRRHFLKQTGTPSKIPRWQEEYGIPDRNVYNYETLPEIADNDEIDVIYIVTPPGVHARDAIMESSKNDGEWVQLNDTF